MCSLTACDLKMNVSLHLCVSAVVAEIMVRNPMLAGWARGEPNPQIPRS